jgi:hypothetical protein
MKTTFWDIDKIVTNINLEKRKIKEYRLLANQTRNILWKCPGKITMNFQQQMEVIVIL